MPSAAKSLIVLRNRAEFLAVAAHGKKWVAQGLIVQVRPAPEIEKPVIRYGLTASGKVGNAVIRNRARRRLRALANDILLNQALPGFDYVLIARAATAERDFQDLKKDLIWSLKKMEMLRA